MPQSASQRGIILRLMISGIIFDADGVLVNINGEQFSKVLARDYNVDSEKVVEFFTGKFQDCLVGKADLKESIASYLESFGWPGTVEEILDYWFTTEHSINEELVGYIQVLRTRGMPVVLATNQEQYRTQYMLDHMGFKDVFDTIYSSAHLGLKKPALEFFDKVVRDMQFQEEVLFWDDDPVNIEGAKEYGLHAEFYSDYGSFKSTMNQKYSL